MLTAIIAFFRGVPVKVWTYVGAFVAGSFLLGYAHHAVFNAGYEKAKTEYTAKNIEAQNKAIEDAKAEWKRTAVVGEQQVRIEEKIVERIKVVTREIPKIVVRTIAPECRDLGPDILRLYNEAIASNSEGGGASIATEPAGQMPANGEGNRF